VTATPATTAAAASDWIDVAEARARKGLRLVLTAGVPGPWGEAAKAVFRAKGIPFARVRQEMGSANDALVAWTGRSNAPIAVFEDERPRDGWAEIVLLAERLAPEPRLLPADPDARALAFGLIHELAGEDGLGWSRRLMMLDPILRLPPGAGGPMRAAVERMGRRYGHSPAAAAAAPGRVAVILDLFSRRLRSQRAAGSRFLLGDSLSAVDLYWAAFAALVRPLPESDCAMPAGLRASYTLAPPLADAADPQLLEHRDRIYREVLTLPVDL
jgi:glutathione S-transferase